MPPYVVLVINDNPYGLMVALSYLVVFVHRNACRPYVGFNVERRRLSDDQEVQGVIRRMVMMMLSIVQVQEYHLEEITCLELATILEIMVKRR